MPQEIPRGHCLLERPSEITDSSDYKAYGVGAITNPYLIYTANQFASIGTDKGLDWRTAVFEQCADIDLNDYYDANGGAEASQFSIGDGSVAHSGQSPGGSFRGRYYGNNFKISNFTYIDPSKNSVAIFGLVEDAILKDMVIEKATVQGVNHVATLVGVAWGDTLIDHIKLLGAKLETSGYSGGVVGIGGSSLEDVDAHIVPSLTITNIYVDKDTSLKGEYAIGLVLGASYAGSLVLNKAETHGVVDASEGSSVGGIVGHLSIFPNAHLRIDQVYSTATIMVGERLAGGLIGSGAGTAAMEGLRNCAFRGTIIIAGDTPPFDIGGIVSWMAGLDPAAYEDPLNPPITMENCYSDASIIANSGTYVGGLVGRLYYNSVVKNSFSTADQIEGANYTHPGFGRVMITSSDNISITNIYYSNSTTCTGVGCDTVIPGVSPTDPANFKTQAGIESLFGVGAWDFENVWEEVPGDFPKLRFVE